MQKIKVVFILASVVSLVLPGAYRNAHAGSFGDITGRVNIGRSVSDSGQSSNPSASDTKEKKEVKPQKEELADSLPDAEMKNQEIENGMMKAVVKEKAEGTPVKARILRDSWTIERNDFGKIIKRYIMGAVALKRSDGTCYYVTAQFAQSSNGASFNPIYVASGWGSNDCGIKKELKPEAMGLKSVSPANGK